MQIKYFVLERKESCTPTVLYNHYLVLQLTETISVTRTRVPHEMNVQVAEYPTYACTHNVVLRETNRK